VRTRLTGELRQLRDDMGGLMQAAVEAGSEAMAEGDEMVISGERNLLSVSDLSSNMSSLRQMFEMFEQKTGLMQLLDVSSKAGGVQIFIGGESKLVPMDEMSVVTAPYEVNGKIVGTLGVIGPTRMAYERVIPIVDITAKLLSNALSQLVTRLAIVRCIAPCAHGIAVNRFARPLIRRRRVRAAARTGAAMTASQLAPTRCRWRSRAAALYRQNAKQQLASWCL
jgi:hypothetical protein